jgi:hypothetical protein
MNKTILFSIILVLVLATSGIGFSITLNRINSIQSDLQTAKNTLDEQNRTLNDNQITISDLRLQIEEKDSHTDNLTESVKTSKSLLEKTTSELDNMTSELDLTKNQLRSCKQELYDTKLQLDGANIKIKLMQDTFGDAIYGKLPMVAITDGTINDSLRFFKMMRNFEAVNPTWEQLMSFLQKDKTDQKPYVEGLYTCGNFAEDVFNAAETQGIRAAIVCIRFKDSGIGHALNAFKTTDKGLVFIDCTGDVVDSNYRMVKKANVKIGEVYECEFVFQSLYFYSNMGEVSEINIYW